MPDTPSSADLIRSDLFPHGFAEQAFAAISALPGGVGAIGYRKLKRRLKHRAEERFQALAANLQPGDVAMDLGANVGDYTAILAASGADVYAYEPEPNTFALLEKRFAGLPNVRLHQAAMSDHDGTAELVLPASFSTSPRSASKAASIAHDRYKADANHHVVAVTVLDIKEVIAGLPQAPQLIKMDIEGAELCVLRALRDENLLHPGMSVFVETHERLDPTTLHQVKALQGWAKTEAQAYVNLYWG